MLVVPVNPATEDRWTYPPFSAHQDEAGWIWGVSRILDYHNGSLINTSFS